MIRKILRLPDPILTRVCDPVQNERAARSIAADLHDTLKANASRAVGLAAPQIGRSSAAFAIRFDTGIVVFINPAIVEKSFMMEDSVEQCLSVPGRHLVRRSRIIEANVYDTALRMRLIRLYDQDAIVFQHEFDHLSGILIGGDNGDRTNQ